MAKIGTSLFNKFIRGKYINALSQEYLPSFKESILYYVYSCPKTFSSTVLFDSAQFVEFWQNITTFP